MRPLTGFSKRALAYSFLSGVFLAAPNADMADGLLDVVIRKDSEGSRWTNLSISSPALISMMTILCMRKHRLFQ